MDINRHFLLDSSLISDFYFNFSVQCTRFQPCRTPQVSVTPSAKKRSFVNVGTCTLTMTRDTCLSTDVSHLGQFSCIETHSSEAAGLESSVIVISLLRGGFYTMMLGYARHQYARPPPRKRYITCYLGNTTVYCFGALKLLRLFKECMPSRYTDLMKMANEKKSITEGKIHLI